MRKNKVLACMLTAAMVMTGVTLPGGSGWRTVAVEAAEAGDMFIYGDFECTYLEDGTIKIVRYLGHDAVVVIPEEINTHRVTIIGFEAFMLEPLECSVTDIVIPAGITNIVSGAFQYLQENSINMYFPLTDRGKQLAFEYIGDAQIILYETETADLFPLAWNSEYQAGVFYQSEQKLESANFDTVKLEMEEIDFGEEIKNVPNISQEDILNAYNISAVKENGKIIDSDKYIILSKNDYGYTAYAYRLMEDDTLKYITDKYLGEEENKIIQFEVDCLGKFVITKNIDYIDWTFDEKTGTLTIMGRGDTPSYYSVFEMPWSEYEDQIVTVNVMEGIRAISEGTFRFNRTITDIEIPGSVTEIGEAAFADCNSLESITLSEGLITIGDRAFSDCDSLTSIEIPHSVTEIGEAAFAGCNSLESVTLTEGLIAIGDRAFSDCDSLTSIEIPGSVTEIGEDAFEGCVNIVSFNVALENMSYSSADGALYNYDKTVLIAYPNTKEYVNVAPTVTEISQRAFDACVNLSDVSIPQSDKWVVADSLGEYELTVTGDGNRVALYFIPEYSGCYKISFDLGEQLTAATYFRSNRLGIEQGENVVTIHRYLKQGTIFEMDMYADVFDERWEGVDSAICSIIIEDDGSGQCGENAFYTLKEGVLTIRGDGAMNDFGLYSSPWYVYRAGIEKIVIEDGITTIGACSFAPCNNLESIEIPDSVLIIGDSAFYNDTALEQVIGGNGVTTVGEAAFNGTPWIVKAEKIKIEGIWKTCLGEAIITTMAPKQLSDEYYYNDNGGEYIILPDNTLMLTRGFSKEDMLPDASGIITIINSYAYVAFDGSYGGSIVDCLSGRLELPDGLEIIGDAAFASQTKLEEVIMPDSLIGIGSRVFYYREHPLVIARDDYSALSSVALNDGLKWIGEEAFLDCSLTEVTIPASVTEIGARAFGYCCERKLGEEGYYEYEYVQVEGFTIYGYIGTAAETYADENGFTFIALDEITLGDVNEDGTIDYFDAMAVLQYDAELIELTDVQLLAGDVNGDGNVDSFDAVKILQYDAELIESFE